MSVLNGTPCSVPSLSDGMVAAVSSWLTEQEPELSTRLDLAKLLAGKGGTSATYTSDVDTLANVQSMLGKELADRVNDVSYDTDPEDLEWLNEMLSARGRPRCDVGDVPGPRAAGRRPCPHDVGVQRSVRR